MKQLKPLMITAAVLIVLAGALFAVFKLLPEEKKLQPTPTLPGGDNTIYIINKSAISVKKVEVETDYGEKFTIEYEINNEGTQVATLKNANKKLAYDNDDMYTLAGYVGILAAIENIPDANGRDAEFGFKKPKRTIKITYTDKEKIELLLGADAPSGDGVYIKRKDNGKVYLIGGSTTQMLMKTTKDYRKIRLFDPYSDISEIKEVSIIHKGEKPVTIRKKAGAEPVSDKNPVAAQYEITSPDQSDASNQIVEERVLTPLIAIKAAKLVEDNPKKLKQYGLDKPVMIEFKDSKDQTIKLKVGDKAESGARYVMLNDVPSVLETEADIPFLNIKHTELMMQLIWLHNVKDVAEISYALPNGQKHVLKLNATDQGTSATYDGGAITSENATNLFMHTVQFTLQGVIEPSMKYGAPEYTMTMKLKSGEITTLQLARINERQYAALVDGKPAKYFVNVKEVNALADAFTILSKGGTIPSIF